MSQQRRAQSGQLVTCNLQPARKRESVVFTMPLRTGPNSERAWFLRRMSSAVKPVVLKPKVKPPQPDPQKDPAFFLSAPEISVFVAVCVMINELRGLDGSLQSGEITLSVYQKRSKDLLTRLGEAAEATQRFDVVFPLIEPGRFSPFFWRWFNWWYDHIRELTPSRIAEIERRARESGSLINDLRPRGDWVSYRSTPPVGL